jgi:hypothetical protein
MDRCVVFAWGTRKVLLWRIGNLEDVAKTFGGQTAGTNPAARWNVIVILSTSCCSC